MSNSSLQVTEQNGDLVVDSRLIAMRLGIEHRAFMQTLKRYQDKIEARFGVITFEMSKPLEGGQGGRPEKYTLLTEDQATTLMTFSKNTEIVVDCKLDLVAADVKNWQMLIGQ
jgi:anti-repressor protein